MAMIKVKSKETTVGFAADVRQVEVEDDDDFFHTGKSATKLEVDLMKKMLTAPGVV